MRVSLRCTFDCWGVSSAFILIFLLPTRTAVAAPFGENAESPNPPRPSPSPTEFSRHFGLLHDYLPDPIFYHTYLPLLFEVDLPRFNPPEELDFCTDLKNFTAASSSGNSSELIKLLTEVMCFGPSLTGAVIQESLQHFDVHNPSNLPTFQNGHLNLFFSINDDGGGGGARSSRNLFELCDQIQLDQSVGTIMNTVTIEGLQKYYKNFKKWCSSLGGLAPMTKKIDHAPWHTYIGHEVDNILLYFVERLQWGQVVQDCKAHELSHLLVNQSMLAGVLEEAEQILGSKNYTLSLQKDAPDYYYRVHLVNCYLKENQTLVLQIFVPVLKRREQNRFSKIVQVQSIPFLKSGPNSTLLEICGIDNEGGNIGSGKFLVNFEKLKIHDLIFDPLVTPTSCESGKLCQIPKKNFNWPDLHEQNDFSSCLSNFLSTMTTLTNDESDDSEPNFNESFIKSHCPFKCTKIQQNSLPLFYPVTFNRTIILYNGNEQGEEGVIISCEKKEKFPQFLKSAPGLWEMCLAPLPNGALDVTLPCGCKIFHKGETALKVPSSPGCQGDQNVIVKKLWPIHWTKVNITAGSGDLDASVGEFKSSQLLSQMLVPLWIVMAIVTIGGLVAMGFFLYKKFWPIFAPRVRLVEDGHAVSNF